MMSYERFVWEGGGGGVWKPRVQFKVDVFQCPVCLGTKRATSLIRYLFPKELHFINYTHTHTTHIPRKSFFLLYVKHSHTSCL